MGMGGSKRSGYGVEWMNNEEWKKAYREGFADGYAAAKKEMNYQNFPPVYYGGSTPNGPIPTGPIPRDGTVYMNPRSSVMGTPTPGYAINQMETLLGDDC
jgi:hypothetical protein